MFKLSPIFYPARKSSRKREREREGERGDDGDDSRDILSGADTNAKQRLRLIGQGIKVRNKKEEAEVGIG